MNELGILIFSHNLSRTSKPESGWARARTIVAISAAFVRFKSLKPTELPEKNEKQVPVVTKQQTSKCITKHKLTEMQNTSQKEHEEKAFGKWAYMSKIRVRWTLPLERKFKAYLLFELCDEPDEWWFGRCPSENNHIASVQLLFWTLALHIDCKSISYNMTVSSITSNHKFKYLFCGTDDHKQSISTQPSTLRCTNEYTKQVCNLLWICSRSSHQLKL